MFNAAWAAVSPESRRDLELEAENMPNIPWKEYVRRVNLTGSALAPTPAVAPPDILPIAAVANQERAEFPINLSNWRRCESDALVEVNEQSDALMTRHKLLAALPKVQRAPTVAIPSIRAAGSQFVERMTFVGREREPDPFIPSCAPSVITLDMPHERKLWVERLVDRMLPFVQLHAKIALLTAVETIPLYMRLRVACGLCVYTFFKV